MTLARKRFVPICTKRYEYVSETVDSVLHSGTDSEFKFHYFSFTFFFLFFSLNCCYFNSICYLIE